MWEVQAGVWRSEDSPASGEGSIKASSGAQQAVISTGTPGSTRVEGSCSTCQGYGDEIGLHHFPDEHAVVWDADPFRIPRTVPSSDAQAPHADCHDGANDRGHFARAVGVHPGQSISGHWTKRATVLDSIVGLRRLVDAEAPSRNNLGWGIRDLSASGQTPDQPIDGLVSFRDLGA